MDRRGPAKSNDAGSSPALPSKFPYSAEGYIQAMDFLHDYGYEHLLDKELSTDGYTAVALANSILKKGVD